MGGGIWRPTKHNQTTRQPHDWVLDERGEQKVSVPAVKKQLPFLRKVDDSLVYDRLAEAELVYLRRRKKAIVGKTYYRQRIAYCEAVKRKHQATLEKWAYTDGTTYFLDRNDGEHEHSKRRSLGTHVWRRSDNTDAMHEECLGPSSYSKGQGRPVRVWGMVACGRIHIEILDEGEAMNTTLYVELIEDKFESWMGNCEHLVCDFEGCIRGAPAVAALEKIGLPLVEGYPVSSQDFNAMENVWFLLKQRLDETMPVRLESRCDFIVRLKSAVAWANRNRGDHLWYLCTNQKERVEDCLTTKPAGGRTKW